MDRSSDARPGGGSARGAHVPFIGRQLELEWLDRQLRETMEGRPQVAFIAGEAGIGKTRLAKEFRAVAAGADVDHCYGRCYEDLTFPYLPFIDGLLAHVTSVSATLPHTLGRDLAIISRLVHRDAISARATGSATSTEANLERLQLFLAVSRATIARAQQHPTLVILEDLHWADRSSLELFGHLVTAVADTGGKEALPLMIVVTHRPLAADTKAADVFNRLQRESICHTLEPRGLNEAEVAELISSQGLPRPAPQLVTTVCDATQGNPLFIEEVVHHLVTQGVVQDRAGQMIAAVAPADLKFPDRITGMIAARIQSLSDTCRGMLTVAACLGDSVSLPILRAATDASEDALQQLVDDAVRQRLIVSEGPSFQFAHPLIRHVFYTAPSPAEQQRLHRQIAETLERVAAGGSEEHLLEIAHHLISAGSSADAEKVIDYARRAGEHAFAVGAWSEAAAYYEAALSAAAASDRMSLHDRGNLHYRAGLAHYRDLDVGPCIDEYGKGVEAYRQAGELSGLAQALMEQTRARFSLGAVQYGTRIDTQPLEAVLGQLGEQQPALRGRILSILAEVRCYDRQPDQAEPLAYQALRIGEQIGDESLCAHTCHVLGWAHMDRMRMQEARESWQRSLAHARRSKDHWVLGWPLGRIPLLLMWLGQFDEARAVAGEALEVTRTSLDWAEHSLALSVFASVAAARGESAATQHYSQTTVQMAQRSHYPWGGAVALPALACARALCGHMAAAHDAIAALGEPGVFEKLGVPLQVLAWIYRQLLRAHAGEVEDVRAQLAGFPLQVRDEDRLDVKALPAFCALVEIADLATAPALAAEPYQVLALAAERGVRFTSGWVFLLPRVLGVAATLNSQWDAAEAYFQAALAAAAAAGAQPELGRTQLDYARMLVARGGAGERRAAGALLNQAAPIFSALRMEPFLRRATQLAESLAVPLAAVPTPGAADDPLDASEVEILALVARGRSDDDIASELLLSPATVAGDLRRIFQHIGVDGRAAATAYAMKKRLLSAPPRWAETESDARRKAAEAGPRPKYRAVPAGAPLIIVFSDMEGSTDAIQRLGDMRAQAVMRTHNTIIRGCLEEHGGVEIKHTGDGFMASFTSASGAIDCAVSIQRALAEHNRQCPDTPIRVRIGLNAGEPVVEEGQLFGAAVNAAARICAHAEAGQILVSDVVRKLSAGQGVVLLDRGHVRLKGFRQPFHLHAVEWKEQ